MRRYRKEKRTKGSPNERASDRTKPEPARFGKEKPTGRPAASSLLAPSRRAPLRFALLGAAMLAFASPVAGCAWRDAPSDRPSDRPPDESAAPPVQTDPIRERVAAMSLEEKLGQMLIVGIDGTTVTADAKRLIANDRVGGFILYKPNIESVGQTVELLNGLKRTNREQADAVPLFLSVDQEGGSVSRLPPALKAIPSSRDVAKTGDAARAEAIGGAIGEELAAFGFNVNFAPVLDVDSNPRNPVIGSRSFGPTADVVSSYGIREMHGLQAQRIIPVVKHFPGHGDTSVDSHLDLPVVDKTLDELRRLELIPFADAVRSEADAVMIAHILLPKIDPGMPASMSSRIVTGLLREELGFDGVVVTDDMTMGAITQHYDIGQAAVLAVRAGSDIVLVAHGREQAETVLAALKQAAQSGDLPAETIDRSVYRILSLKERYKLSGDPCGPVDVARLNAAIAAALGDRS